MPRGIRRFFIASATAAKPVNDTYLLNATAVLPSNFAYILTGFNYSMEVDTAPDWESRILLSLGNHIPNQPVGSLELIHATVTDLPQSGSNPSKVMETVDLTNFTGPFWSTVPGAGVTFTVQTSNEAAAVAAAGFLTSHVEFLEYDLTQAQRFWINTPIPVLSRG